MQRVPEKKFPVSSKDYKLYEEVGEGVSATVYRALCIPLNEIVAIKVLDLEKCNNDLDGIRREVQTMTLIDHPNLLRAHCSFTADRSLWVVMPYLAGGSCLHMMKSAHPDGLEEPVIATMLREVLKALVYLHSHGHIHRDVKAGNILIDFNGSIKLADFGVSACMFDTGDRQRSRNTFVGTPCWMAPEVMQQLHGYDFKADIWSFGITALELAHGHAPFSKYPPMKVLLMTLQNAPPGLDYERDKKFSKSFKELVATCLVKDPKKRPTSEKLLKHHFFKNARSNEYLAKYILEGVAPLGERFRDLKAKEADFLVQNKLMHGDKEQLSQQEYIRGISAWNFNLEDLKMQAALIQNDEGISYPGDTNCNSEKLCIDVSQDMHNNCKAASPQEDGLCDPKNAESSLASFPIRPLQALKGHFDISEDDNVSLISPKWEDALQLDSEIIVSSPEQRQKIVSGSLLPEQILSSSRTTNGDKENVHQKNQRDRSYSGPLLDPQKEISNHASFALHALDETSEVTIVQQKGRFKVTSDAGLKATQSTNCSPTTSGGAPAKPTIMTTSVLPSLQYIFQQSNMQREQIIKLIKYVDLAPGHQADVNHFAINDVSKLSPASSNRERELKFQLSHLQKSIGSLTEELQKVKTKNAQLELKLFAIGRKERMLKENREH